MVAWLCPACSHRRREIVLSDPEKYIRPPKAGFLIPSGPPLLVELVVTRFYRFVCTASKSSWPTKRKTKGHRHAPMAREHATMSKRKTPTNILPITVGRPKPLSRSGEALLPPNKTLIASRHECREILRDAHFDAQARHGQGPQSHPVAEDDHPSPMEFLCGGLLCLGKSVEELEIGQSCCRCR